VTPPLPTPRRRTAPPADPEALYDRLSVTDTAIGALWRHQSHVLTTFAANHLDDKDVAIELPTGSGKTLVGALVAEWRRQATGAVSALACPTKQLAQQAFARTRGYGIDATLLIGPNASWPAADRLRGLAGQATIITTYSSVFNSNPRIEADWLVLDDAHAADGYVASPWSLTLPRLIDPDAYRAVIAALAGRLSADVAERLLDNGLDPSRRPRIEMFGPDVVEGAELREAAHNALGSESKARWASDMLADHGGASCAFVAWDEILIRPMTVPTEMHPAFANARQRVYLSATLGEAGEIERAFGRTRVSRVATPSDWERQGTGRRLVIAPGAAGDVDPDRFIRETIASHERALVLVPSAEAAISARRLLPEDWEAIGISEAGDDLGRFVASTTIVLVAANRYDGIDLPGQTCSLIVLEGLPTGTHLQERFLAETVNAMELLRERVRCRIVQGMGRATRSRSDRAVVLVSGSRLIDFLADPENRRALRAEIQAELEYAIWLATEGHDLRTVIDDFENGNVAELDEHLRGVAEEADLSPPSGAEALAAAARAEVLASRAAWRGAFDEAAAFSLDAAALLASESVAPSRTVQKTMAASFASVYARESGDPAAALWAIELARDAVAAARSGRWRPRLDQIELPAGINADGRVLRIVARLRRVGASGRLQGDRDRALRQLSEPAANGYEDGWRHLGVMLGFESVRPERSLRAAPDGAWRDGPYQIGLEAKSEQLAGGELSAKIIRQANTHEAWIAHHLSWDTDESLVVLVSPRTEVDEEAIPLAQPNVALVHPDQVMGLIQRAAESEAFIASRLAGLSGGAALELVERALTERGLTTPALIVELGANKIVDLR
jgi:hypothetical protein